MGIHEEMPQPQQSDVSLLSLLLQAQAKRRLKVEKKQVKRRGRRRPRGSRSSVLMKRRRPLKPIEKKIKTLKKLIPNPNKEPMGLDGLFRETADYILALQMKVKVMQIMVNVLTGSDDDE